MVAKTIAQELRETKNFAKLATVYRHIAKFLEGVKKSAPNVPNNALDPTIKALERNLEELRGVAKEITGYDVAHDKLMLNFGDEFGAATGPGIDTRDIDVLREYAASQPFKDADVTDELLTTAVLGAPAAPMYGRSDVAGSSSYIERSSFESPEGRRFYDVTQGPLWREHGSDLDLRANPGCLRGIVNRWIAATVAVIMLAGAGFGAWLLFAGDDGEENSVTDPRIPNSATFAAAQNTPTTGGTGPLTGFSQDTQNDLAYFTPRFHGYQESVAYVVDDPEADSFTSFGQSVTYVDDFRDRRLGSSVRYEMNATLADEFTCGSTTGTGMTVVCAEGVSGAPRAGEYVSVIGSFGSRVLDGLKANVEYKYSAFFEDRGRTLAFPEGDPRPEFPNNTLTRTNSYLQVNSVGGDGWALTTRWSDGMQFQPWETVPRAASALSDVRAVIGGNTVMFIAPGRLFSEMTYFNVGTDVHTAGADYAPDNVAQDVLGATPRDMKRMLSDLYTPWTDEIDDEEASQTSAAIRVALADHGTWIRTSDADQIVDHLHYSTIQRWGEPQCLDHFRSIAADETFAFDVRDVTGPITWDWQIYGQFLGRIPAVYEAKGALTQAGNTSDVTAHFAWDADAGSDGLRVFSPCIRQDDAISNGAPTDNGGAATDDEDEEGGPGPLAAKIRDALPLYEGWRRTGNGAEQFSSLHPISLTYWGEDVCRTFYDTQIGADPTFAFLSIGEVTGPTPYTYMATGATIGTADAYSVQAETTIQNATQTYTWRFGYDEARDRLLIFQACAR